MNKETDQTTSEILIIDNSVDNLQVLSQVLSDAGYNIRTAKDGHTALSSVEVTPPDLILLTIRMSGMNGIEVCRRLKNEPTTQSIPVIFMGALDELEDKVQAFEVGGVDYIAKPFQAAEILARVKTHVTLYQLQNKLERQVTERTMALENTNTALLKEIAEYKQTRDRSPFQTNLLEAVETVNAKHTAMIENIGDVIGIVDADGMTIYQSPNIEKWFGWKPEEIIGTNGWDKMHPDDIGRIQKEFTKLLEKETASTVEYRFRCKDGTYKWIELTAVNRINEPAINGVLVNYHDITTRKQSEKALRNSEERFRELVNTINSGVAIYKVINDGKSGSDYIIQEFNEFSLKHEQLEKKEVIGKSLKDIRPNIDEYGLIDTFRTVWKTGESAFFPAKVYVDDKYSNYYENRVFRLPSGEIVAIYDDVTVQENAIAKIKESQERFDLAMKASRDGLFDWNLITNEIYYSPGWKRMLGYENDEIPNDFSIWETNTHPEDVKRSWQMQQELISKKRDRFEMEFQMKHKNGHWVDILSRAEAIFDENGVAVRIVGTHIDISDRKRADRELQESEEKYKNLVETASDAIYLMSDDGTIIDTNQSACDILGKNRDEIVGQSIDSVDPNYPVAEFLAFWKDIPLNKQIIFESTHQHKNGSLVPVELSAKKYKLNDNIYFYGIARDMTKRKEAEKAHQESEEKYRLLHENAGLGIGYFRPDGIVISFNSIAAKDMNGVPEDFVGKSIFDLFPKESAKFYFNRLQKAVNSDESAVYEDFIQLPTQEKWFLSTYTKIVNANNEISGIQIISQDITVLKKSEVALQESKEKFSSAFYDSPIPLMMLDYETGIRFDINEQFVDVFGYTREELIGNSFLEKTIAVDAVQVQNSIDLIRENSFFRNLPFDMLTKSGEIRQVLVSSARINSEHGNLFMNSYLDITELKQAEKALQKSTQLLEASQSIAKVGGWELDIATNKLFWTAETYRIHETSPEEFNPTVDAGVSYFLPESRRIISAALKAAIERGQGYDLVLETFTTKGHQITVRTTCEVTLDEGRPAKLTGIFQDITEQKQAEKALRERNQELARLYRASDTFMATSFPDIEHLAQAIVEAMLQEFSQTNCSLVLVDPDTPILNRIAVAGPFANEVRNQILRLDGPGLVASAIRSGEVLNVADVQSDPDYLPIWPDTRAELVIPLQIDNQIIGAIAIQSPQLAAFGDDDMRLMVTFADRSAVALQNTQLRIQSEQIAAFNKSIIQSMADGIIVENNDGIITFANPAAAAILGYAQGELTGMPRTKYIPNNPRPHPRPDTNYTNSQAGITPFYELTVPRQDGQPITFEIRETPRFVMDEFVDNMLVFTDITSRRAAEEEKDRLLQQIQAQTTYLAQIINAVPEGVVLFDSVGHVLLANPAGERDLAILSQHQPNKPVTHLGERPFTNFLYPSQQKGMWHEAQANNRIYEVIARPVEIGNEQRWVMVLNDVTQQREYQYYQQSQNQLASVGQLAAGIAHDFNNIMGVISIYAEMLQATPGLPVTAHSKLETIHKQTQHAVALIKQILDFSRRSLLEPLPVNLVIMVKEVVKLLERTLPENIHLQLVYDQKNYVIFGDPTSLQQLLMNLSVNARDAMPAGGTLTFDLNDLQIEADEDIPVAMMKPGHWLRLTVTDTGEGITTDHQARIFDPFFTTKQPDKGTGLGLAQVYGIVQQHNGEITVDSKLGEGTTFTLYFPLLDKEALVTSEKPGVENVPAGKEAILLVEDNEAMRLALAAVLVQLNYDVFTAANGEEALQLLESLEGQTIDMVITDMVMPGMSGKELAETLLQRFDLKILIITGHPLDRNAGFSQDMPAISWMSKPFSQSALATRIRSLFDETG